MGSFRLRIGDRVQHPDDPEQAGSVVRNEAVRNRFMPLKRKNYYVIRWDHLRLGEDHVTERGWLREHGGQVVKLPDPQETP